MSNNEDNDNTSVRSIITGTNNEEQNELESIVKWTWDESKLTNEQLTYKREFLDKHPELDALVVQAYYNATIEVDALPAYYKSADEIANFVKGTNFADLHNNRQGLGTAGLDSDYVFLPTPESNDLYPYLVAKLWISIIEYFLKIKL